MEFREKAAIRIKHWVEHNASHLNEYEAFAEQLEAAGRHRARARAHGVAAAPAGVAARSPGEPPVAGRASASPIPSSAHASGSSRNAA